MRSDDQLLALFRAGNEDAFRVIHDRYRQRLFAYTRQMLPSSTQDAEDALQDVFVRAYSGLRANHRPLTLRPWLYRVAHNRCVDELRRPVPPPPAVLQEACAQPHDPIAQVEQRESLRRLILDLRRLPAQQRSALLMRELGGMSYAEVSSAMDVSVPAVKSLLVRARIGLAQAAVARDTACVEICDEITLAHDRGVRASGTVRRHLADCGGCRQFQSSLRRSRRQFAALVPVGPMGLLAKMLGIGGGGAAGGGAGAAATGGATATTGVVIGGGTAASVGGFAAGASHVATLIAAAVVTAGGAVAIQHSVTPVHHRPAVHEAAYVAPSEAAAVTAAPYRTQPSEASPPVQSASPPSTKPPVSKLTSTTSGGTTSTSPATTSVSGGDNIVPTASPPTGAPGAAGTGATGATPTGPGSPTSTGATSGSTTSTGTAGSTGTSSSPGTGTSGTTTTGTGSTAPASGTGTPQDGTGSTPGASSGPPPNSPPGP